MLRACCFFLLTLWLGSQPSLAGSWDVEMPPRDNYTAAKFRLWIPDDLPQVRGLLVLLPGYNGDGRGMSTDSNWQARAREWGFGIVAGCIQTSTPAKPYVDMEEGSGKMFLEAFKEMAKTSAHPEVAEAPVLMWGHSAGGMFSANFACWEPARVIAFVGIKGSYYTDKISAPARKVPGLMFIGGKDTDERRDHITSLVMDNRRKNANWAYAVEPNAGHEVGKTVSLAMPFFDAVIKQRLPPGAGKPVLKEIGDQQAWLGDPETLEVGAFSRFTGAKTRAVWLPDADTAKLWQSFVKGEPLQTVAAAPSAPVPSAPPVADPVVAPTPVPTLAAVPAATPPARPKAVRLLAATPFPIVINGQVSGSVTVPAGAVVKVVSAIKGALVVEYRGMRNTLAASQTDWPAGL